MNADTFVRVWLVVIRAVSRTLRIQGHCLMLILSFSLFWGKWSVGGFDTILTVVLLLRKQRKEQDMRTGVNMGCPRSPNSHRQPAHNLTQGNVLHSPLSYLCFLKTSISFQVPLMFILSLFHLSKKRKGGLGADLSVIFFLPLSSSSLPTPHAHYITG